MRRKLRTLHLKMQKDYLRLDKGMTYVYRYNDKNYINLTNVCTNDCDFCIRKNENPIPGYDLWLDADPTAEQVIEQLDELGRGDVVFCGYGEPTCALEVMKEVGAYVKSYGGKVRLNTNGLGNLYFERDITAELAEFVNTVSISLNAPNAREYDEICHSAFGLQAYPALLNFAQRCVQRGIDTVLSVVDVIPRGEIELCRRIVERTGARFRVRRMEN